MKRIYKLICLAFLLALVVFSNMVARDFQKHLNSQLAAYHLNQPLDKNYLQTDRSFYKEQETIWYKGFIINANITDTGKVSATIVVELRNAWGDIIGEHNQQTLNGSYEGSFLLPKNAPGGIYKLIARSGLQEQWGKEFYFTKEITVQHVITPRLLLKLDFDKKAYGAGAEVIAKLKITDLSNKPTQTSQLNASIRIAGKKTQTISLLAGKDGIAEIKFRLPDNLNSTDAILHIDVEDNGLRESITRSIPIVLNHIEMQFYPEGGYLVSNIENKLAFEALNEYGKGADIKGFIFNKQQDTICMFQSYHQGMGAFLFTPKDGEEYFAQITEPVGNNELRPIPAALHAKPRLLLQQQDSIGIRWNIFVPDADATTHYFMTGQAAGKLFYSEKLDLAKGENSVYVNTESFPMGIAVFTLFANETETAERLVFLNDHKKINIELETDKTAYAPLENIRVRIKTTDEAGKPIAAVLGLSVVDEQIISYADDKQNNLLSYMLLSYQLKGQIHEPYFYFDPEEEKAEKAREYLLLTHGWRQYTWADVLNPSPTSKVLHASVAQSIYGYVLNNNGEPVKATVFVVERGGKRRVAKLKTTSEGHFVVHNVTATDDVALMVKRPNYIYIIPEGIQLENAPTIVNEEDIIVKMEEPEIIDQQKVTQVLFNDGGARDHSQTSTSTRYGGGGELSDMIVIGYSTTWNPSNTAYYLGSFNNYLGVTSSSIFQQLSNLGNPDLDASYYAAPSLFPELNLYQRNTISYTQPIITIDGVPISTSAWEVISYLTPQIKSIERVNGINLPATYGPGFVNGSIHINPDTKVLQSKRYIREATDNYNAKVIPKKYYYVPRTYIQEMCNMYMDNRTVYWKGDIVSSAEGIADIKFNMSMSPSVFRITAEAMNAGGYLFGSTYKKIIGHKDFFIDTKAPLFIGAKDTIYIPVMLSNKAATQQETELKIETKGAVRLLGASGTLIKETITVPPGKTAYYYIPVSAQKGMYREGTISIESITATGLEEKISIQLPVKDVYYPYTFNKSFSKKSFSTICLIPEFVPGTLNGQLVIYSSMEGELFDGIEAIIKEPYGCFEQLLSAAFPNVYAMQLLEGVNAPKDLQNKLQKNLRNGYDKLIKYQCYPSGGFEWFGGNPPNQMLTAYGYLHFHELQKIMPNLVAQQTMQHTLNFLLSNRDGNGGFKQTSGKYGFNEIPDNVNNAFLIYVLSETGDIDKIEKEYNTQLHLAQGETNWYINALLTIAAYNKRDMETYNKLVSEFTVFANNHPLAEIAPPATVVQSNAQSRNVETIAFWLTAMLKDQLGQDSKQNSKLIEQLKDYIISHRKHGQFGNTQATSVCLQALTAYRLVNMQEQQQDTLSVVYTINGIDSIFTVGDYAAKSKTTLNFGQMLKEGKNNLVFKADENHDNNTYSINISAQRPTPPSSASCPVRLQTQLERDTIRANETVRLTIELKNTTSDKLPMSVAKIGIPAGMSLQAKQLKELQEKEVFDFYEIIDDYLVIYYRGLLPQDIKTIAIDLKAEIPGIYTSPASSAYPYYTPDDKDWQVGLKIVIEK